MYIYAGIHQSPRIQDVSSDPSTPGNEEQRQNPDLFLRRNSNYRSQGGRLRRRRRSSSSSRGIIDGRESRSERRLQVPVEPFPGALLLLHLHRSPAVPLGLPLQLQRAGRTGACVMKCPLRVLLSRERRAHLTPPQTRSSLLTNR